MALGNFNFDNPYVFLKVQHCNVLHNQSKTSVIIWCPNPFGIPKNETVDLLDKKAAGFNPCSVQIPFSDFKPRVKAFCQSNWQDQWSKEAHNKLCKLQPTAAVDL